MEEETLTITFVSQSYIKLAQNWLNSVEKSGYIGEIKIYALDGATKRYFPKYLVEPINAVISDLDALWRIRVEVFRSLFINQTSFIHSDVDAIWLKNPTDYLGELQTPLVFSQGTIHPHSVHKKLNFVFCCGFFYLSSTKKDERVIRCISEWTNLRDLEEIYDDQTSINEIFGKNLLPYPSNVEKYLVTSPVGDFTAFKKNLVLNHIDNNQPFVTLLPHSRFPRILYENERSSWVVAHPLTPKSASEKIDYLKLNGLWFPNN